jgi:hypothetical protein
MAQIKDFVVKQGIVAEGNAQSLTTASGALIVAGGAGVGGNINVGGSIKRIGDIEQGRDHNIGAQLSLRDATFTDELITGRTAWGIVNYFGSSVLDTISENATYTNAASIYVKGAPTGGDNLTIEKAWSLYITSGTMFLGETSGNTSTTSSQALQVAGGISFNNGMVGYGGGSLFGPWSLNSSEILTRATQNVGLAEFPDGIRITTSTQSFSTTTGALVVDNNGGVGIGGNLYVGGYIVGETTGTFLSTLNATSTSTGALTIKGGLGVGADIYAENGFFVKGQSSTSTVGGNSLQVTNNGGLGVSGTARFEDVVWITDTTDSSGPGTGALIVQGGAVVERNFAADTITVLNDAAATSSEDAALTVAGGVGIGKNLIIGDAGSSTGTTATNALVVAGGGYFGGSLTVDGSTVIKGDLFLLGTGTSVTINSTNTYIVDPIIEIGGGIDGAMLELPDVYDKGLLIHYQNSVSTATDYRAFIGLENTTERFIFKQEILPGVSGSDPFGDYYNSGTWSTLEAGSLILRDTTESDDATTGALIVQGGIAVSGNSTFASSTVTFVSEAFSLTNIVNNAIQVPDGGIGSKYLYISEEGYIGNARILTTGTVNDNIGGIFTLSFAFVNLTESESTDTGAVTVAGGVGIGGNLNVGGDQTLGGTLSILDDTESVSTDTGALTVVGGAGIGKNINIGGQARIYDTTQSTSTDTGALIVGGGAGIAGDLVVGGLVTVVNTLTVETLTVTSELDSTATDNGAVVIAGGLGVGKTINATQINIQLATINSGSNAVSTSTGDLVVSGGVGIGKDVYIGDHLSVLSTETSTLVDNGALTVAGGAGIAKDVTIGGTITRSGQVVKDTINANGAGLVLSAATYVDNLTTGSPTDLAIHSLGQPTVQGVLNPTWENAATLYIANEPAFTGGADATNKWALNVQNGRVRIGSAVSNLGTTSSGALQVAGGVGIGGNLTAGGEIKGTTFLVADNKISSAVVLGKNTDTAVTIDTYVGNEFTTAKYLVQVIDLGTPNKFHVVELMVTYDGAGSTSGVYISQYGIITNTGELGTFDVTYNAGNINVIFTPNYTPVSMNIRALRMAIVTQ